MLLGIQRCQEVRRTEWLQKWGVKLGALLSELISDCPLRWFYRFSVSSGGQLHAQHHRARPSHCWVCRRAVTGPHTPTPRPISPKWEFGSQRWRGYRWAGRSFATTCDKKSYSLFTAQGLIISNAEITAQWLKHAVLRAETYIGIIQRSVSLYHPSLLVNQKLQRQNSLSTIVFLYKKKR